MKRYLQPIFVLLVSTSIGGCVSAKQKTEEQQELARSISRTSDPDAVKGCIFIMNLRPDGLHNTPEAQVASLVIPKQGVSWVVFGGPGNYELYSCKTLENSTARPVEARPEAVASPPVETKAVPAPSQPKPEVSTKNQTQAKVSAPEGAEKEAKSVYKTRVTSNPEAVKGCKFLESFTVYEKVFRFQEDVVRAGGNLGYIVATNQDGEVIGESYLCSEEAKP